MIAFSEVSPPLNKMKNTLIPIVLAGGIVIAGIADLNMGPLQYSKEPVSTSSPFNPASSPPTGAANDPSTTAPL